MSLSGNLGFVSIDEVLRLLTRSNQQGSVDITGNGLHGRVFVGKGGIDLATTYDDDDLHRHLVNSGYVDEKVLNRVTSGETTLAAIAESDQPIVDLVREMTVESLYQIAVLGKDFDVHEGATTPYASPKTFDLEALLADADERSKDWKKVAEVIPDLTGAIRFRRDLGEREEVTVKADDWMVLSKIGTGSPVTEIADHLGTTEFWTARVAARLVKNELVLLEGTDVAPKEDGEVRARTEDFVTRSEPVDDVEPAAEVFSGYDETTEEPARDLAASSVFETPASEIEDVDPDESWWQEPTDEDEDAQVDDDTESKTPEVVSEGLSEIPSVEDPDGDEDADVEEDTETFLEKVFSELGSSEPEAEEGHGLLRRRRMGTLRDFSSDS